MSWRAKVSRNVLELTARVCNNTAPSAGARAFILNNYSEIIALNPSFDFLVREGSDNPNPTFEVVYHPEVVTTPGVAGYTTKPPVTATLDLTDKSEAEILAMFQKIVETGAVTPQVTSSVPKPIAVALCEDQHGMHSHDLWPGAALGFNFANMQPDDEEPRDLSPEEVAKFKAELTAEEFEDFMAQEPKMAVPAVA